MFAGDQSEAVEKFFDDVAEKIVAASGKPIEGGCDCDGGKGKKTKRRRHMRGGSLETFMHQVDGATASVGMGN